MDLQSVFCLVAQATGATFISPRASVDYGMLAQMVRVSKGFVAISAFEGSFARVTSHMNIQISFRAILLLADIAAEVFYATGGSSTYFQPRSPVVS